MTSLLRCKPSRPKGARERNKEICKLIMGLTYDENTRSMFVNNLKAKMSEYNLETVYLASPPNVSSPPPDHILPSAGR